jgi:hypothetical protein
MKDPADGQAEVVRILGPSRSLQAGLVFVAIYAVTFLLLLRGVFALAVSGMVGSSIEAGIGADMYIKLLFVVLVPPACIALSLMGLGQLFSNTADYCRSVFITGVCSIPPTLAALAMLGLGLQSTAAIVIAAYGLGLIIALLYIGLAGVLEVKPAVSLLASPAILIVAGYATYALTRSFLMP